MKTQAFFIDLTERPPRSFRVRLGGFVILARMIDKGRATLSKKNGEYIYNSPTDQHLVRFLGFDADALLNELAAGKGDGAILQWVLANAKDTTGTVGNRSLVGLHGKTRTGQRRGNACTLCRIRGSTFPDP